MEARVHYRETQRYEKQHCGLSPPEGKCIPLFVEPLLIDLKTILTLHNDGYFMEYIDTC